MLVVLIGTDNCSWNSDASGLTALFCRCWRGSGCVLYDSTALGPSQTAAETQMVRAWDVVCW